MKIPANEGGASPLHIYGTFYKADGKTPYPGVLMYVYHTDATGHYSKKGNETGFQKWHGYLHGWCITDAKGHYEIHTIRPAPYPTNTMPAHLHAAVREPGGSMYYISDFVFRDDTLVNSRYLATIANMKGGDGIVDVVQEHGTWKGQRNIILN